jgi:1,4-dihydroxy-2-naphthoate octaprenyltransferase
MNYHRWLTLLSPALLLATWELAVQLGWLNRIFYPPPSEVLVTLWVLLLNGQLVAEVSISLFRIAAGFLLGGVPAIVIGLLMGISPAVRAIMQPFAAAMYPVPKIALLPLVIVAVGLGEASKVLTIALSVFFLVVLGVAASVQQIDAHYFEVARSFGARRGALFWTVALPASLPGIMSSIKLGMGFALTLIVGVEFVGASEGIGWLIWRAYEVYAIDRMLAGLVAVALVGWALTTLLDEVERRLLPWKAAPQQRQRKQPLPQKREKENSVLHTLKTWFWASRPWSYTAAVVPVLLGTIIAASEGFFDAGILALVVLGSVLLQAGTNFANDYYDFHKGTDKEGSLSMGGSIVRGDLSPRHALIASGICFSVGSLIGLYLVSIAGPLIFWVGVASVLVGFFYTAGPFALAYNGLGEIAVFIFMGPVIVMGSYYMQTTTISLPVVLASLPVGFLVAAILHANNLRDLEDDRKAGKRTMATILGRDGANIEYYVLIGGTYLSLMIVVLLGVAPWLTLITVLTLPTAVRLMRLVATEREPGALHPLLQKTAMLHMQFGVLLVVGWAAAWVLQWAA